ncbi:WD40-repeat-containing domain protein [Ilyonectria robusta]|uniref:WD40-repeat-containing domain protein n=1 Tax=Ilyonectria robusta TaxID=1079257 RepID=UPI001E8CC71C|nr:WD40-repeat-containing domain protein [Ilyonectria robusta]KAH8721963.1 WD40-repeat-containing domain protein [Ilyonectria robusta]
MSSSEPRDPHDLQIDDMDEMLDADDIAEEIPEDDDHAMDSDDDGQQEIIQNDSIAYFDECPHSLFSIAQHPVHPSLIAVGGSAGREQSDGGVGWVFDTSVIPPPPVLPASYESDPAARENTQLNSLVSIEGHSDTINALAWTLPRGEFLVSGGYDGRLRAWKATVEPGSPFQMELFGENEETTEINWIEPCPSPAYPNHIAVGTTTKPKKSSSKESDSEESNPEEWDHLVWVYKIDPSNTNNPLEMVNCYVRNNGASTAGAWTHDGLLLATVAQDSSLYVWDVWGEAAAKGLGAGKDRPLVALTSTNEKFYVEGGLLSIAMDPHGAWVAVGGGCSRDEKSKSGGGFIRIISLPRFAARGKKASVKPKAGGEIIGSFAHSDEGIETLSVTIASVAPPMTLLAAGSNAGSIAVYDMTHYSQRRLIPSAHDDYSVVKVEFIRNTWLLTSCGTDGVVRRWDLRGRGSAEKEWKGHRPLMEKKNYNADGEEKGGGGEEGGVMGFVHGETGEEVVTVGDDALSLVFRR